MLQRCGSALAVKLKLKYSAADTDCSLDSSVPPNGMRNSLVSGSLLRLDHYLLCSTGTLADPNPLQDRPKARRTQPPKGAWMVTQRPNGDFIMQNSLCTNINSGPKWHQSTTEKLGRVSGMPSVWGRFLHLIVTGHLRDYLMSTEGFDGLFWKIMF